MRKILLKSAFTIRKITKRLLSFRENQLKKLEYNVNNIAIFILSLIGYIIIC